MYIHTYGDDTNPVLIVLAPMMVSGEDLYKLMSPYFTKDYFIIAPDQGGHGLAGEYHSALEEYDDLRKYLLEHNYKNIKLVYGASMGVAVGWRLFNDDAFHIEHAWFDGVALSKSSPIADFFMRHLFRNRKKKLAKSHVDASPTLVKIYGYDFAKMMTSNFERITLDDIDAICYACCHYQVKELSEEKRKSLHLDFGEHDMDYKLAKKAITKYLSDVSISIRKGCQHCEYMAKNGKRYVEEIEAFISK